MSTGELNINNNEKMTYTEIKQSTVDYIELVVINWIILLKLPEHFAFEMGFNDLHTLM